MSDRVLPDFPWDSLAPAKARAAAHPQGLVDLSVGSPVDPTPDVIAEALAATGDAHAYPAVAGSPALKDAVIAWFARRRGVEGLTRDGVLPTIGSKEFITSLPFVLDLGPGDTVVFPEIAYPSYELGAALVGATALAADDPADWPESTRIVWTNSPGNPDGTVLDVAALRARVKRARELGAIILGDECYAELGWEGAWADEATPSILDPEVTGGDPTGVIAVYSLSKQSNLAGYRAGFVAGDPALLGDILAVRKHIGLMPPAPVERAAIAALGDDAHVAEQKARYRYRRDLLAPAFERAGFRIDGSVAGLYLWVTRGEDCWASVAALAEIGILAVPGTFYGSGGAEHVRVSLTATDAAIAQASERLASLQ